MENNNTNQLSESEIDILKKSICPDLSDTELNLFLSICKRTGLNPLARQIYAIVTSPNEPKWRKFMVLVSIDGFRVIAERSGKYLGQTAPEWCGADGVWKDVWVSNNYPVAARVGIIKEGNPLPLYVIAHWDECAKLTSGGKGTWEKMPRLMLAKCAEAQALRKAFPQDLSGIYSEDEISAEVVKQEPQKVLKAANTALPKRSALLITVEKFIEMISGCESVEAVKGIAKMIPSNLVNWKDANDPYLAAVNAKKATFEPKPKDEITVACESATACKSLDDLDECYNNLHPSVAENIAVISAFETHRNNLKELELLPY